MFADCKNLLNYKTEAEEEEEELTVTMWQEVKATTVRRSRSIRCSWLFKNRIRFKLHCKSLWFVIHMTEDIDQSCVCRPKHIRLWPWCQNIGRGPKGILLCVQHLPKAKLSCKTNASQLFGLVLHQQRESMCKATGYCSEGGKQPGLDSLQTAMQSYEPSCIHVDERETRIQH